MSLQCDCYDCLVDCKPTHQELKFPIGKVGKDFLNFYW